MRPQAAILFTLFLAVTVGGATTPRKAALVKELVILSDPQDVQSTDAFFRAYEENFSQKELEQLLAFLKSNVGRKFLAALKEEKKLLLAKTVIDPVAELQKSRENATRASMRSIASALITRSLDFKKYPMVSTIAELAAALEPRYIHETPRHDGWGSPFRYIAVADGSSYRISSAGPDSKFGSSDDIIYQDGYFLSR